MEGKIQAHLREVVRSTVPVAQRLTSSDILYIYIIHPSRFAARRITIADDAASPSQLRTFSGDSHGRFCRRQFAAASPPQLGERQDFLAVYRVRQSCRCYINSKQPRDKDLPSRHRCRTPADDHEVQQNEGQQ